MATGCGFCDATDLPVMDGKQENELAVIAKAIEFGAIMPDHRWRPIIKPAHDTIQQLKKELRRLQNRLDAHARKVCVTLVGGRYWGVQCWVDSIAQYHQIVVKRVGYERIDHYKKHPDGEWRYVETREHRDA